MGETVDVDRIPGHIRIFSPGIERINLALPIVLLAVALFMKFYDNRAFIQVSNLWLFITSVFFLDVIHNVFSIVLLICFPEARRWIDEATQGEPAKIILQWVLVFLLLLAFFSFGNAWIAKSTRQFHGGLVMSIFVAFIGRVHHVVAQVFGFSIIYNRKLLESGLLSARERVALSKSAKRERILFDLVLILSGGQLAALVFWQAKVIPRTAMDIFGLCSLVVVAMLLMGSARSPAAPRSNKTVYLLRLLSFPFASFSPFALGIPAAYHGIEFGFLFGKMLSKSEARNHRAILVNVLLPFCLLALFLLVFRLEWSRSILNSLTSEHSELFNFLAALSTSVTYLHFYLDRQIFRMRDPAVSKHIGPLLV